MHPGSEKDSRHARDAKELRPRDEWCSLEISSREATPTERHTVDSKEFAEFIDSNMAHNYIEAKILNRLIKAFKAAGDPIVNVWDGEEENPVSTSREIQEQVFNLDECHLYTQSGGWVFFVNGNEWDALSDYTTDLEPILAPVNEWIDKHN